MKSAVSRPAAPHHAGARVHTLLMQFATLAGNDLRRIATAPEHGVHHIRTRMKKIRSILRLARSQIAVATRRAISATAGEIKDAFGAARNKTIMARLRRKISGPEEGGKTAKPATRVPVPAKIAPRVLKLQSLIAALPLSTLQWPDVCRAYAKTCRSVRRSMKRAKGGDAVRLHEWRRRVKDLYYQSLALDSLGGLERRIRLSHRLGSDLGRHNDLEVLRRSKACKLSRVTLKRVKKKQAALRKRIFATGAKLLRESPEDVRRQLLRRSAKLG
jgi:hypothetical protein